MEIKAAMRLRAARNQDWFDKLDGAAKKKYLAEHPNSKFGMDKPSVAKDNVDATAVKKLRDKIANLKDAIKNESPRRAPGESDEESWDAFDKKIKGYEKDLASAQDQLKKLRGK